MSDWISIKDRLPEIDYSKPNYSWEVDVLAATDLGNVVFVTYKSNAYAKTERGKAPRFEWCGRVCPFNLTHWMPLPEAPTA